MDAELKPARETPFYLRGNYAPVQDEVTLDALEVEGAIPPELDGLYLRNGPNPSEGSSQHWFFGDGMLHGLKLGGGKAHWYRNRFVQTRQLAGEKMMRDDFSLDYRVGAANTSVIAHADRIFALVESSFPHEVRPDLSTVGPWDAGGALKANVTAHPKICPVTGEMHAFGYGFMPPWLMYHRFAPDGSLIESFGVDMGGPTMIHDFAITAGYVIFLDLPVVFDLERALKGKMPYVWSDDYPARIGVMPRGGTAGQVRWASVNPCYVFHVANAFEADGKIVIDVSRYPELWRAKAEAFDASAQLWRWELDLASMTVAETLVDDRSMEFPTINPACTGLKNRVIFAASDGRVGSMGTDFDRIMRYDTASGVTIEKAFGERALVSEFAYAAGGVGEDEGWVMGFVFDRDRAASDFVILDARTLGETARIRLPRRVPQGFHGAWIAGV